MKCVVTAGPTYESLDGVRRLTNFSTGRLGSELAGWLTDKGHEVSLLLGYYAVYRPPTRATEVIPFTTTADLGERLRAFSSQRVDAIFHAAAVSDFSFGKVFTRSTSGQLREVHAGKYSTRDGPLLAELLPTPKLIAELRPWFPQSQLVGWKYEVDGTRAEAIEAGRRQMQSCATNLCVVNGPAYGEGFGVIVATAAAPLHVPDSPALFTALLGQIHSSKGN